MIVVENLPLGGTHLPTSNDMLKILDIQDGNIEFKDHCVYHDEYKGEKSKFIEAKLTYTPMACVKCQAPNENYSLYRNGTQLSRITLPMAGIYPTYLLLKKQRFMCKSCKATFTAKTPVVKDHCFIANTVKGLILLKTTDAQSIKNIARDSSVSAPTVQRVINQEARKFQSYDRTLPANLSFDEFKYAKGQLAFEYIDAKAGEILDVLPSRDGRTVKSHFISHYSLRDRENVQTITIDMNASYTGFIPILFPKAKIIIDRFHIIQLINRSMNKTRVSAMNRFNTSNGENKKKYRRLKRYWKKMLKKESNLSHTTYSYYSMFGQRLEADIVSEMLSYDAILNATYAIYQAIIKAVEENDYDALSEILNKKISKDISSYMRTSLKTLKKHLPYIKNTFTYPYSNGKIEGTNNKIKVLNRVAYGYRNFSNYKNRIILHFNMKPKVKKKNTEKQKETYSAAA